MKTLLPFLFLLFAGIAQAQYTEEYQFILPSDQLGESRAVWVSLPRYYHQNNYSCHTLYLFDGDASRSGQTVRAIRNELFESGGYIRPLIIVGIEQKDRSTELNPYGETGRAFFNFIDSELLPFIDSTFNTNGDRIVAGHSLGGQYALQVWMKSKQINSCFAFSPAIYNHDNRISKDLEQYLAATSPKGVVYVNNGNEGTAETMIKRYIEDLKLVFARNRTDSLLFQYKEYQGYGHNFTPITGMTDALLFHFSKWRTGDETINKLWDKKLDPIDTYQLLYERLDRWAGFRVKRENDLLNNLAYHYYSTGDTTKAVELIDYALRIDDTNAFSYLTRGQILMNRDPAAARAALLKALLLLKPEDVFENSRNFREYEFWKSTIGEYLEQVKE